MWEDSSKATRQMPLAEGLALPGFRAPWQGPGCPPEANAVLASWAQLWNYPVRWCVVDQVRLKEFSPGGSHRSSVTQLCPSSSYSTQRIPGCLQPLSLSKHCLEGLGFYLNCRSCQNSPSGVTLHASPQIPPVLQEGYTLGN